MVYRDETKDEFVRYSDQKLEGHLSGRMTARTGNGVIPRVKMIVFVENALQTQPIARVMSMKHHRVCTGVPPSQK